MILSVHRILLGERLADKILKRYHNHNPEYAFGWWVRITCSGSDFQELCVLVEMEAPLMHSTSRLGS